MRIGLGLLVTVAFVLLGTLVVLFRSLPRIFHTSTPYTVVFSEAPGVGIGTPVRRSGIRIGEVTGVDLDDETGAVRVAIGVDKQFALRRYEQPTLITGLLGSDASIDFIPKPPPPGQLPDREPVPPGTLIAGLKPVTLTSLVNRAAEVVPTTQETMNDIRKSLQQFEKLTPLVQETLTAYRDLAREAQKQLPDLTRDVDDVAATARTFGRVGERVELWVQANQEKVAAAVDSLNETLKRASNLLNEENQRNVSTVIRNVKSASDNFDSIAKNVDDVTKEGRTTVRRLNDTLVKTDAVLTDVQKATKPFADRGDRIFRSLDEALDKLSRTLGDVDSLVRAVGESNGTLNKLLTDPSLYNRIDDLLCTVQKALPRVLQDVETGRSDPTAVSSSRRRTTTHSSSKTFFAGLRWASSSLSTDQSRPRVTRSR
jgi:phospholipid/cholesterol/gamma-HCH transport system substrate-binding protein